jgi:hypothetical protein
MDVIEKSTAGGSENDGEELLIWILVKSIFIDPAPSPEKIRVNNGSDFDNGVDDDPVKLKLPNAFAFDDD